MKKYTLQLLEALFTGNNYHRLNAVKIAVFAVLLVSMSTAVYAVPGYVNVNITTPTTYASENVCPGATNVNIYAFTLTGNSTGTTNTVTACSFNEAGGSTVAVPGDIIDYKLWSGAGGGAGVLLATSTTNVFTGLSEIFNNGTITNYWITMDVAATPTPTDYLQLFNMGVGNVTANGGVGSVTAGVTAGGNTQTLVALPTVGGITATPTPLCSGATLNLTATGGTTGTGVLTSYNWSGPGGYSSNTLGSTQTYITPASGASGVYSLTVTYPGAGCTSLPQASGAVTVNPQPVLPATMFICNNIPVAYTTLNSGVAGGVWSSSVSSVATVEPTTGNVWPSGAPGTATVIKQIAAGGCSAQTTVTVATRPAGIHGSAGAAGSDQNVCTGSNITLSSATTGGVWSSSFITIATVVAGTSSNIGIVTGSNIAPGSGGTTILYTNPVNGCDTTITVNVYPTPAPITGSTFTVCQGSQITLNDITDGTTACTWSSSAVGVATVTPGPIFLGTPGGIVTGVSAGGATITYEVMNTGCFVTQTVSVNPLPLPITGPSYLCTGLTNMFSDATPGGTWSSAVPTVATIGSASGIAGGVQQGVTNIIYQLVATGCAVSQVLTVNQQPGPISGPDYVCAGNTIVLSDAILGGTWSSVHTSVAIVDSTTGVVTGQHDGPIAVYDSISYDLTSCIAVSYTITVNPAPGPINGVSSICLGFTTVLSDTTAGGAWSNGDPLIDAFTTAPTIRGVGLGVDVITYILPTTCYVLDTILVNPNPDSIRGTDSVCQGAMVTLSDATLGGTWSSTAFAIARIVDSSGVVTGISAGGARISYTLATGCYAVDTMTVKPPVTASVSISKDPPGITCAGTQVSFIANPVNGGFPTYQWYKFTTPEGLPAAHDSAYIYSPNVGDVITVMMTTHQSCAIDTIVYDSLAANVYPNGGVVVSITSSPNTDSAAYLGDVFTFFANVTYGGTAPTYQWYMNNLPIAGATNSSYFTPVYKDDTFYCQVNGTSPCDSSGTVGTSNRLIVYATYLLGVPQLSSTTGDLVLFPNPGNGNIVLSGNVNVNSNDDLNIEVSDMLGHIVYSGKTTPQNGSVRAQISLNNLPSGTYLLHVNSESLNQVFHFVINK